MNSTRTGLIYMAVSTMVFMTVGIFIGVKISGNNDLQLSDFAKVVATVWLTQILVFASMFVIVSRYDEDE
jgi:uncharacterized membrane protein AbrB (regulator of aidB expression)